MRVASFDLMIINSTLKRLNMLGRKVLKVKEKGDFFWTRKTSSNVCRDIGIKMKLKCGKK